MTEIAGEYAYFSTLNYQTGNSTCGNNHALVYKR